MPKCKTKQKITKEDIWNALYYIKNGSLIREALRRYKVLNTKLRWRARTIPKKPGRAPL